MKSIFIFLFLLERTIISSFAQVGINTHNPQAGVLHIDAKGNNNPTGVPLVGQTNDDVFVSSSGKVAIGHISPSYQLDIRVPTGTQKSAFRLQDGTEGNSKILLSDPSGNAYWGYPGEISLIKGMFTQTCNNTVSPANANPVVYPYTYMNAYIKLPKGRWVVMVDLMVIPASGHYTTSSFDRAFYRITFSDNTLSGDGTLIPPNGAGASPDIEGNSNGTTTVASLISANVNLRVPSMVSGFVLINNQTNAVKTYYMKFVSAFYPSHLSLSGKVLTSAHPTYSENKIIALPLR